MAHLLKTGMKFLIFMFHMLILAPNNGIQISCRTGTKPKTFIPFWPNLARDHYISCTSVHTFFISWINFIYIIYRLLLLLNISISHDHVTASNSYRVRAPVGFAITLKIGCRLLWHSLCKRWLLIFWHFSTIRFSHWNEVWVLVVSVIH